MEHWEYDISVLAASEIVAASQATQSTDRVLFCGAEGQCFFDDAPNPYLKAMVGLLNERGQQGWILVQTVLRQQDMICFWRRRAR